MVGLRRLTGSIRCDEWASSSKPLWATVRSTLQIGQMLDDNHNIMNEIRKDVSKAYLLLMKQRGGSMIL